MISLDNIVKTHSEDIMKTAMNMISQSSTYFINPDIIGYALKI